MLSVDADLLLLFSNECVALGTYPHWASVSSSAKEEQQPLSLRVMVRMESPQIKGNQRPFDCF